jgi:hypothetical protein
MVPTWWVLVAFLCGGYAGMMVLALLMIAGKETELEASTTPVTLDGLGSN